jgi:hypothetical protein
MTSTNDRDTDSGCVRRLSPLENVADELGVLRNRRLLESTDFYRDELLADVLDEWRFRAATDHSAAPPFIGRKTMSWP